MRLLSSGRSRSIPTSRQCTLTGTPRLSRSVHGLAKTSACMCCDRRMSAGPARAPPPPMRFRAGHLISPPSKRLAHDAPTTDQDLHALPLASQRGSLQREFQRSGIPET